VITLFPKQELLNEDIVEFGCSVGKTWHPIREAEKAIPLVIASFSAKQLPS
jgi:hypothetical protein